MLPSFCSETVTIKRATETIERGSAVKDWDNPVETSVLGCSVQPAGTSLAITDRQSSSITLECWMPPSTDVMAGDRITIDSKDYEIDGDPLVQVSPTGALSHIVCPLVRWEG
jgi:hypothetical protein